VLRIVNDKGRYRQHRKATSLDCKCHSGLPIHSPEQQNAVKSELFRMIAVYGRFWAILESQLGRQLPFVSAHHGVVMLNPASPTSASCLDPTPENLCYPPKRGDYIYFETPPYQSSESPK
jgi:hypothetical protein